jgi:hypothetical protein
VHLSTSLRHSQLLAGAGVRSSGSPHSPCLRSEMRAVRRHPRLLRAVRLTAGLRAAAGLSQEVLGARRVACADAFRCKQNQSGSPACTTATFFLLLGGSGTLSFCLLITLSLWCNSLVLRRSLERCWRWAWEWPLLGSVVSQAPLHHALHTQSALLLDQL